MTTVWVAFIVAFLTSVLGTRGAMTLAKRTGVLDMPDGYRKVHAEPTPRLGGVGIFVAFAAPLLALLAFRELSTVSGILLERRTQLWGLLVGASLALGLGVLDDIFDLRARWKLVWQILIASVVFLFGFQIHAVSNPFGSPFELGVFAFPVTLIWFVGCMNAVNLLDGLDGLAAGTSVFVCLTLFIICVQSHYVLGMFLMACISGAVLGFLIFNFPPARIFLGDSGSMLLGFLIAALSLLGSSRKAEAAVALFIPVIALGLPIFDTLMAIIRRWYKHLPITTPDRQHIHHVLVSMGYSKQRAVLTLYAICLVLGGAAVLITFARSEVVLVVLGSLVIMIFVCVRVFGGVKLSDVMTKLSADNDRRKRSAAAHVLVSKGVARVSDASTTDGLWEACVDVFDGLELGYAKMGLCRTDEGTDELEFWTWEGVEGSSQDPGGFFDTWSTRLVLPLDGRLPGELLVGRQADLDSHLPEMPELLDRLRESIVNRLRELSGENPNDV